MTGDAVFAWHPQYQGRSVESVRRDLQTEIERDQRAYELALVGAEESEHDALASVVDLERRWSTYDFGWHEAAPDLLANRIVEFEWAREQRQELISWNEYRNTAGALPASGRPTGDWRASMSDEQRRKVANIIAGVLVALIVIVIIVVVAVVFM
jgi:hypothetical protein